MPEKDTETMTRYDDYTVEELRAALQRVFMFSDLTDADMDEMDKILSVLREKAPFDHPHTTEEMWKRFASEHAEELASLGIRKNEDTEEVIEKEPAKIKSAPYVLPERAERRSGKKTGFLRVAMIAAAMMVIIIAITVTASAIGIDLWGWVPKWNSEALSFGGEENTGNEFYDSSPIVLMLTQSGITEPLFPHWIPEGFRIEASIIQTDPLFLHEGYSNGDRYLSITIEPTSIADTFIFQKDGQQPLEYVVNQQSHYITSDVACYTATWQAKTVMVQITGDISLEEMKQVINSIYEVTK